MFNGFLGVDQKVTADGVQYLDIDAKSLFEADASETVVFIKNAIGIRPMGFVGKNDDGYTFRFMEVDATNDLTLVRTFKAVNDNDNPTLQ